LTKVVDGKTVLPQYLLGCACGSSEIVLPLASFLGVEVDFVRSSNKRGDTGPRVVLEHYERIDAGARRKHVLCIEDYVCSGRSLRTVMEVATAYEATGVTGASINLKVEQPFMLQATHNGKKLHLYTAGRRSL
jgi:hypoxanthine-guanine phosphoribosyltransferase